MNNIAEILKDAPKGTKLYSPIFGECILSNVGTTAIGIISLLRKRMISSLLIKLL